LRADDEYQERVVRRHSSSCSGEILVKRRTSSAVDRHDWDARAAEALDEARSLPNGPLRNEALKKASLLKIAADSMRFFLPAPRMPRR